MLRCFPPPRAAGGAAALTGEKVALPACHRVRVLLLLACRRIRQRRYSEDMMGGGFFADDDDNDKGSGRAISMMFAIIGRVAYRLPAVANGGRMETGDEALHRNELAHEGDLAYSWYCNEVV